MSVARLKDLWAAISAPWFPNQGTRQVRRQRAHGFYEPIPDGLSGVVLGQVDQHDVSGGPFDQGSDR